MFALLLVVIISILFSLFATINTQLVTIHFGEFDVYNAPLYLALLISMLIGVVIPSVLYFLRFLSYSLTVNEKNDEIQALKKQLNELTKKAHHLEIENVRIKNEHGEDTFDENSI